MTQVKPYGDTLNDGAVQLSFTLPIAWSEAADEAARQLVAAMGFDDVAVVEGRPVAAGFSFFVVYGRTPVSIDVSAVRAPAATRDALSMEQVDERSPGGWGARSRSRAPASEPTRTPSGSTRSST
jgi:beta-lysine 5,6-aminomutase beta subunit